MDTNSVELILAKIENLNYRLDQLEARIDVATNFTVSKRKINTTHWALRRFVSVQVRKNHYLTRLLMEVRHRRK